MRLADGAGRGANWFTLAATLCTLLTPAHGAAAGTLDLHFRDRDGHGVADVVVVAVAADSRYPATARDARAVMDQRNRKFVPQVLVVQAGTSVDFPNNDTVSHQVYSFSPARRFQLPLYKGEAHPPLKFDSAGLVVLGCNIHDEMVGYIYVTDSPWFATTGADGNARIEALPPGTYRLDVWGPRVADPAAGLVREVTLESNGAVVVDWQLKQPLRPRPSPGPRDVDWDY